MNDTIWQVLSVVVQIAASVVTIISTVVSFASTKGRDEEKCAVENSNLSLGHEEVYPFFKWLVYLFFGLYYVATIVLLYVGEVSDFYLYSTIVTYIVMLVCLLTLAVKGRRSLESRNIVAPKKFWQVLFNKIPSYLEEIDGPLRICLVNIGIDENDSQWKNIRDELKNKKTALYTVEDDLDVLSSKSNKQTIHGVIAVLGVQLMIDEVTSKLHFIAQKFPYTPIGYVSYSAYPSSKSTPYINLKAKDIDSQDYINHIIFRYYTRSRAWQRLARSSHKFILWIGIPLLLFFLAIPVHLLIRNYRTECSKVVLFALEAQDDESNYTRLVNAMLISPKPADVKIWEKDILRHDSIYNTHRFSEQGDTSRGKNENSMIASVMKAQVFLLYDKGMSCPYKVWDREGKECEGNYIECEDAFVAVVKDSVCVFRWVPKRKGTLMMDDDNIRMMYSFDGLKAVEIVYNKDSKDTVREAVRHSDTYLLNIQQFLIAATLRGLTLDKPEKNVPQVPQLQKKDSVSMGRN